MTDWTDYTPMGDKLYVEIDPDGHVTDAGLVVGWDPNEREKLLWATVLKVGPRVKDKRLKPGVRTLVKRSHGFHVLSEKPDPEVVIVSEDQCNVVAPKGTEEKQRVDLSVGLEKAWR